MRVRERLETGGAKLEADVGSHTIHVVGENPKPSIPETAETHGVDVLDEDELRDILKEHGLAGALAFNGAERDE